MTEGAPQVILEAFAARLPVVATAVGGVSDLVAERGLLAPPGDPAAAAAALACMVADADLRNRLVEAGHRTAAAHTLQAECRRLARFLSGRPRTRPVNDAREDTIECSVLVPVLNEERYIEQTVAAMRSQDFSGSIEFLFADGGSHDRTRGILERMALSNRIGSSTTLTAM